MNIQESGSGLKIILVVCFILVGSNFALASGIRDRLQSSTSVAAHQGGIFDGATNTILNFEKAFKQGAQIIEMDLRLTHDGIPVVFHDETLDKMTNCKGSIKEKTMADLRKCKYNYFFRGYIPSFEEVVIWSHGKIVLNAEFKDSEVVSEAIQIVEKYKAYDWIYFQTKHDPALYHQARNISKIVSLLFSPNQIEDLKWALALGDPNLVVIEIHENLRNKAVIDSIHEAGKLVSENSWSWRYDYEFLGTSCLFGVRQGIDILVTNRPNSCLRELRSMISVR